MTLLIDSHVALWWEAGDATLNSSAREEIEDPSTEVWCSVASLWELAIKVRAGKLILNVAIMVERLGEDGIGLLEINAADAIRGGLLDWDHKDPFDRMIATQAIRRGWKVVTRDQAITQFLGDSLTIQA